VDAVAKALARFEADTKYRDFKSFHFEQAIAFKRRLTEQKNQQTGEKLSKATLHSTLAAVKAFFHWLAGQPGYKSRLQYSDADYFNLSEKDVRVATARREQVGPTLEQARHVIAMMPGQSPIERRDRALIAFTLLTGARDSAIASMKLKHVNLIAGCVDQDAREVKTKFSKTFTTYFFPVGDDIRQIVADWVAFLREQMLWGNDDPLFPATRMGWGRRGSLRPSGWNGLTGAVPRASARSSGMHSPAPGCRTSTRTASGTPWCGSARRSARPPRSSRRGARTWGMKRSDDLSELWAGGEPPPRADHQGLGERQCGRRQHSRPTIAAGCQRACEGVDAGDAVRT
jgi:integrase